MAVTPKANPIKHELESIGASKKITRKVSTLGTVTIGCCAGVVGLSAFFILNNITELDTVDAIILISSLALVGGIVVVTRIRAVLLHELHILFSEQQTLATHDPLTGLYNRRFFEEIYRLEREKCARLGEPLSIILVDVDHFKSVNDIYGHPIGDKVLISIAEKLQATLRMSDACARWGGEEFVILLPGVGSGVATATAEAIRNRLATQPCTLGIIATGSFGVVTTDHSDTVDLDTLLKSADSSVYDAKHNGRDCVRVSEDV